MAGRFGAWHVGPLLKSRITGAITTVDRATRTGLACHATSSQYRVGTACLERRYRGMIAARRRMSSSIGSVSLPVKVFCWLGW